MHFFEKFSRRAYSRAFFKKWKNAFSKTWFSKIKMKKVHFIYCHFWRFWRFFDFWLFCKLELDSNREISKNFWCIFGFFRPAPRPFSFWDPGCGNPKPVKNRTRTLCACSPARVSHDVSRAHLVVRPMGHLNFRAKRVSRGASRTEGAKKTETETPKISKFFYFFIFWKIKNFSKNKKFFKF